MHETKSFCRLCIAACGVVLTVDDQRIVAIRADRDHPISRGYACFKGLQAVDAHHGASRQLHTLRRGADGSHERVTNKAAFDAIAAQLGRIVERDGANSVALKKEAHEPIARQGRLHHGCRQRHRPCHRAALRRRRRTRPRFRPAW